MTTMAMALTALDTATTPEARMAAQRWPSSLVYYDHDKLQERDPALYRRGHDAVVREAGRVIHARLHREDVPHTREGD